MAIYLTKKDLKNLSESLGAKKLCNNIYYYENILHSTKKLIEELELVECVDLRDGYITADQIAYCAGIYGNSGQLHKVTYYDDIKKCYYTKFVCVY